MKKHLLYLIIPIVLSMTTKAQIGVGTESADPSALLDLVSQDKGFLPPRVVLQSLTDRTTIVRPAKGLMVYHLGNYLEEGIYVNTGRPTSAKWRRLLKNEENSAQFGHASFVYPNNVTIYDRNATVGGGPQVLQLNSVYHGSSGRYIHLPEDGNFALHINLALLMEYPQETANEATQAFEIQVVVYDRNDRQVDYFNHTYTVGKQRLLPGGSVFSLPSSTLYVSGSQNDRFYLKANLIPMQPFTNKVNKVHILGKDYTKIGIAKAYSIELSR